jgi:hypothetical protein
VVVLATVDGVGRRWVAVLLAEVGALMPTVDGDATLSMGNASDRGEATSDGWRCYGERSSSTMLVSEVSLEL